MVEPDAGFDFDTDSGFDFDSHQQGESSPESPHLEREIAIHVACGLSRVYQDNQQKMFHD
jgi:hypothetical protein